MQAHRGQPSKLVSLDKAIWAQMLIRIEFPYYMLIESLFSRLDP